MPRIMHRYRIKRLTGPRPLFLLAVALLMLETLFHGWSLHTTRPSKPLDAPFATHCLEPDTSAPREDAAIVMLARNSDLGGAVKSVVSLEEKFNRFYHYPIVYINDKPWDKEFVDALTRVSSGEVKFERIPQEYWDYPAWMDRDYARKKMNEQEASGIKYSGLESYHHMCRFNSGFFFKLDVLKPYRWYWRIEPDVEFLCTITYDPFIEMANAKKVYGYVQALWELGKTTPSLFRVVSEYKAKKGVQSIGYWNSFIDTMYLPWPLRTLISSVGGHNAAGDGWNFCHYWSNFEIADMDWFRGKEYSDFFDYLDEAGGLYYERWGDAPIHSLGTALLLRPEQIHYFEDIGYVHENVQTCPANAQGGQLPDSTVLEGPSAWDREQKGGIGCRCQRKPYARTVPKDCQTLLGRAIF